jgi:hypothetical protein
MNDAKLRHVSGLFDSKESAGGTDRRARLASFRGVAAKNSEFMVKDRSQSDASRLHP